MPTAPACSSFKYSEISKFLSCQRERRIDNEQHKHDCIPVAENKGDLMLAKLKPHQRKVKATLRMLCVSLLISLFGKAMNSSNASNADKK